MIKYRLRRMVQILKDFMYIHFKNQLETSHTKHVQSQLSKHLSQKSVHSIKCSLDCVEVWGNTYKSSVLVYNLCRCIILK